MNHILRAQATKVISPSGRTYLYRYPKRKSGQPRKKYHHHPDWKPKTKSFHAKQQWFDFHTYQVRAKRLIKSVGICQDCGSKDGRLEVHHIDGNGVRSLTPNNTPSNLIVLCSHCHQIRHNPCSTTRKEYIIALRYDGLSFSEIGRQLGLSRQRVYQILQSYG